MKPTLPVAWRICLFVLTIVAADPNAIADNAPTYAAVPAIDSIAKLALEQVPLAGLSIAVVKGAEIIHARGYGYADLEHMVPAAPDTVYRIGSLTKQFTAAATLQLIEAGKFAVDDDMRKYVPEYPTGERVVTIRHLLNHTSGIKTLDTIDEAMANRCLDVTQEQIVAWISSKPFDFEPGDNFRYNNSGFWLLGLIIERVTNQTYGEYVRRNISERLSLNDTYYDSYERVIANRARGYTFHNGSFVHHELNSPTRTYAAGALMSTVLDLVSWGRALFSSNVISESSLHLMTSPGQLNNGEAFPYGFGLRIAEFEGHRRIAHGGEQFGFRAFLSYYPDDGISIAVLMNTDGHTAQSRIEEDIAKVVFASMRSEIQE